MTTPYASGIRRFPHGEEVRIERGRKGPGDQLIKWNTNGLQPVRMEVLIYAAVAIYRNEERLFPPPHRGGQMLLDVFRHAIDVGEEQAVREYRLKLLQWEPAQPEPREPGLWEGME